MLNNLHKFISLFVCILFIFPTSTHAQVNFKPIVTDNPFINNNADFGSLPNFLNTLYKLGISIAVVLAIVMIFYAGFTYTVSTSSDGKSASKRRIQAALGGLLLALSSFIILRTINSQLVFINLGIEGVSKQDIEATVVTEEGRRYLEQQALILAQEEQSYNEASGSSTLVLHGNNVPTYNGNTYVPTTDYVDPSTTGEASKTIFGIPIKGQFSRTQQIVPGGNGIERLAEPVLYRGTYWGKGKGSWFGGPEDTTVTADERTGLYHNIKLKEIDTEQLYVALRFDYTKQSKATLRGKCVEVHSWTTKKTVVATPLDWGPHGSTTNKSIDLSPGLSSALGYKTLGQETGDMFLFRIVDGGCSPIHQ